MSVLLMCVLFQYGLFVFCLQGRSSHPTICFNGNQGVREQNPPLTLPLLWIKSDYLHVLRRNVRQIELFLFVGATENHCPLLGERRGAEDLHLQRDQRCARQSTWEL